jgi:uncharacterized protein (DUF2236 family)
MNTDTLPYIPSNMTNDEAFRLYGTLPPERIQQMLDAEMDAPALAKRIKEHLQGAHDGLPCEDFVEDILYKLQELYNDESAFNPAAAERLQAIILELSLMQDSLSERAEAAAKCLCAIEDEL